MKNMYIDHAWPSGDIIIKADGYDKMRFCMCSKREAIRTYREKFNLKYKHFCIYDHTI